ncbi:MAG TPA: hypothetical protein VGN60_09170 [Devosia sp.]|jgi:hypothetical protein|nr:hypothetical protein [Devosia sp.]
MALILPAALGVVRLVPASGIASQRSRGGLLLTQRVVEPGWRGRFATDFLEQAEHQDLAAFVVDVVDRNERIDFVHPRYARPRAYLGGVWPLATDPQLVSVTHGREIVVQGLEVGMQLLRGDRLTIMQGELRCYRAIQADLVVSSSISQALPISPRVPVGLFAAAALVRFVDPAVRLAIVPDSYDIEESARPGPISFEVEEALI